jgi:predicted TPR repeat methyltransferase
MSLLDPLRLFWQRLKTRRKMNRVFSRRADPFRYSESGYELKRLAAMDAALGERRFKRTLEVGCAEGHFTRRLLERGGEVVAVDISSVALERARKSAPAARFVEADALSWGPEGQFDLIVVADVLYYMDKPLVRDQFESTFDRVAKWLLPGGTLLLAHAFATEGERGHRESFTRRFVDKGLRLAGQSIVTPDEADNPVRCLIAVLEKK